MPPKAKSIQDYGGLQPYLDNMVIRSKHRGYGYNDFVKNLELSNVVLRDLFGMKTTKAIKEWRERLERETRNITT